MFKTTLWVAALMSAFVDALKTLTVAMQPLVIAVDSAVSLLVPQVVTSVAELLDWSLVRTNL